MRWDLGILVSMSLVVSGCPYSGGGGGGGGGYGDDDDAAACDDCDGDEFCYDDECEAIFGRNWRVTVVDASVGTSHPDGDAWDVGGGAPDLFAEMYNQDNEGCATDTEQDAFSATWNQYCDMNFTSGGSLTVVLWDEDVADHDYAAGWTWDGNAPMASLADAYGLDIDLEDEATGTVQVRVRVEPNF